MYINSNNNNNSNNINNIAEYHNTNYKEDKFANIVKAMKALNQI
jgi:hypothetical protein